jgi:hypothetical protein
MVVQRVSALERPLILTFSRREKGLDKSRMSESSNNPTSDTKLASTAKRAHVPYATPPFRGWREHFVAERRWFAETFAREKMIDMLKQLAWVVPLTLLIWIYAEREQVTKEQNETIPFELVSTDPNRLVTLRPPQDSNIVVELEGPRARVQDVLHRLRGGAFPQGLRIEIDKALLPNRDHQLRTISLIANHDLFRHNGITVTRTQPDTITVTVDEIVERDARVEPAPGTPNLGEGTKFDPAVIKLRGPRNVLNPEGDPNALVVYAHVPNNLLSQPGQRDGLGLELSLPPPLAKDARVTMNPSKVDATLQVQASDEEWVMPAMTVSLDVPKSVTDKFTVKYDETSIYDVRLIGPKDVIEEMRKPGGPKPYAQLKVTIDDASRDEQRRTLRFVDLPEGVRVDDKDKQRTVAFRLVAKADAEQ